MERKFIKNLEEYKGRIREIEKLLSNPDIIKDRKEFIKLSKEHSNLLKILNLYEKYEELGSKIEEANKLISSSTDEELKEIANEEIRDSQKRRDEIEEEIFSILTPHDDMDDRNVFMEIRAGAGGDEACLFVRDLFRMYSKYIERENWKLEVISSHPIGLGGFKEIIFYISGNRVYEKLKYESGVHRVQRIPVTESGGRIHTSTSSVVVLPEVEEKDIKIDDKDLKIETFRARGHGGQSVNKVSSAVRITHIPTGITVICQDERSQYQNKVRAMKVLLARLYDLNKKKEAKEIANQRKSQIGQQERAEKIRTYNFPQRRITDHRIDFTTYRLFEVMEGDLNEIIDKLREIKP